MNFQSGNPTTLVELVTSVDLPLGTGPTTGANFRGTIFNWGPQGLGSGNQLAVPAGSCIRVTGDTNTQYFRSSPGVSSVFTPLQFGPRDLYFIPHLSSFQSSAGALFCDSISTLAVRPQPAVIQGVSFTPTLSFLLTHTFRHQFGEPQDSFGASWLVTSGAFRVLSGGLFNGNSGNVVVTLVSTSTLASGVITRQYQIDVTTSCDGTTVLQYFGAYQNTDNTSTDRNHGFIGTTRSLIYAACLAKQFCI